MAWKVVPVPENRGGHPNTQFNANAGRPAGQLENSQGVQDLTSVPYMINRCGAVKLDGTVCTNRLRSTGEKAKGRCLGHIRKKENADAAE